LEEGTTQIAHKSVEIGSKIVFNFPLEATFRSTSPFGCLYLSKKKRNLLLFFLIIGPQLVISGYGLDAFGNDVVRGYGTTHIPISPGR
jgi:B9 domain-containing protein 1